MTLGASQSVIRRRLDPAARWRSKVLTLGTVLSPFLLILLLWQLFGASTGVRNVFLPPPGDVLSALRGMIADGSLVADMGASIYRVTMGFLLAAIVGVPIGLLAGTIPIVDRLVQPLNDFTRYLPVAALIPLLILWTGIGDLEKILVIFVGTVFQIVPLVADTARSVPSALTDLARTAGASKRQTFRAVVVPWTLPTVYDQLRVALGWAWSYLVVAEIVAASSGIGHLIIQSQRFIQTSRVMAGIIVIGVVGLLFDLAFRLPRRRLFPWV